MTSRPVHEGLADGWPIVLAVVDDDLADVGQPIGVGEAPESIADPQLPQPWGQRDVRCKDWHDDPRLEQPENEHGCASAAQFAYRGPAGSTVGLPMT